ncbi:MAG: HNH endonuclease signature motif containing protein [Oceanococcaceae bacterium]
MKRRKYTPADLAEIRRLYPHYPTSLIASELGRSVVSVYQQAQRMGIYKSPEYLREQRGKQIERLTANGYSTRFAKGDTAHNKGKRMRPDTYAKCRRTMFKPGRNPEEARNYLPIGSTRITQDGYLERKVTDDPALMPSRRWTAVHRLVWEAAHGPIPEGHIVVFKRGQATTIEADITLDRIELISRAENMRRNTIHNYPEPLKRAIRAKAGLVRRINRIQKERSA